MPSDLASVLILGLGAALLAIAGRSSRWTKANARAREVAGPVGEARLKAYAALLSSGVAPEALPRPGAAAPPAPPSSSPATSSSPVTSSSPATLPVPPLPDPHLAARVTALEAKVAALEAQVGAPGAVELASMRAPRPEGGEPEAPRAPGLRAFP